MRHVNKKAQSRIGLVARVHHGGRYHGPKISIHTAEFAASRRTTRRTRFHPRGPGGRHSGRGVHLFMATTSITQQFFRIPGPQPRNQAREQFVWSRSNRHFRRSGFSTSLRFHQRPKCCAIPEYANSGHFCDGIANRNGVANRNVGALYGVVANQGASQSDAASLLQQGFLRRNAQFLLGRELVRNGGRSAQSPALRLSPATDTDPQNWPQASRGKLGTLHGPAWR